MILAETARRRNKDAELVQAYVLGLSHVLSISSRTQPRRLVFYVKLAAIQKVP